MNLGRKQITAIVIAAFLIVAAGLFILMYFKPQPKDIIIGRWKKVSADENVYIAFYTDGKVFSYINESRTYLGKFTFIDSNTLKFDFYFISSSYFKVKVLSRSDITLTDEHGKTSRYVKAPE